MHKTRESIDAQQAASKKIIRYRLGVSRVFPTTHQKKGEQTYFIEKIGLRVTFINGYVLDLSNGSFPGSSKIHTIRANYPLWAKRIRKVLLGEAVIELFYWTGSPYNSKRDGSKQKVFSVLDKNSGCGVQELLFHGASFDQPYFQDSTGQMMYPNLSLDLAKNDGLLLEDFKDWFKKYDLSESKAIIHFTSFRY